MNTVTITKSKFDILTKRASLYEAILRFIPKRKWGIEEYSSRRIKEFTREDRLDRKTSARIKKFLASRA